MATRRDRRILPVTKVPGPIHYATWPGLPAICRERMGTVTDDPERVTCSACREKFFGHAGTDPLSVIGP